MTIEALGYASLRTTHLQDWVEFGPKFLGLQLIDKSRSSATFRMDDRKQRIVVTDAPDAENVFGWEAGGPAKLDALASRLEAHGVPVERMPSHVAALRGVTDGIWFRDPVGTRLEAFHGPHAADDPFRPGRPISGFRTGPLGMGHVVLLVESIDALLPFYRDVLGFRLSDFVARPFKAYFFHVNPRHHSLAMIEAGYSGIHHVMMELCHLDDVGQAYDIALATPERIGTTLGRHTNDFMTSFYARSPSDFMIEYGWGGRSVDPQTWQPQEITHGPSLWGHDRTWLPSDQLAEARALRSKVAAEGLRAPVQVMEGNYTAAESCSWWKSIWE